MNTLKYSHLQVSHAGRGEAKRLVIKTCGARVAHKVRLIDNEKDLSKYILFDCGIVNYLLNGSELLKSKIPLNNLSILYETFVGCEIISQLKTRDDLCYWKSGNKAELEFVLRSPFLLGIDVKSGKKGSLNSLNSFAIFEKNAKLLIQIGDFPPYFNTNYIASLPNAIGKQKISFMKLPHYMSANILQILWNL
ncbi:hypothetical protein BVX93_00770 [bacterium B13(2017)]|nr:hypothetical protein BVX93_00770 [bacterium B13(2017)]